MKMLYGVGVNDADYIVRPFIDGKEGWCPFYQTWVNMIKRCYDHKYQEKRPTYIGCAVICQWLIFSNFRAWMISQDWFGKQLDKDILMPGNKIYSPDTCVFVEQKINTFTIGSDSSRGEWPIGVCWHKGRGKFAALCSNPFTKKQEYLGYFDCPEQAHQAWKNRKHQIAMRLADLQDDPRVADALRARYL